MSPAPENAIAASGVFWFVTLGIALALAGFDLLVRRVPNGCVVAGFAVHAAGMAVGGHAGTPGMTAAWGPAAFGALCALVVFAPVWMAGVMGAGDVKALAWLGFVLGVGGLAASWLVASALAGGHAALQWARRRGGGGKDRPRGAPYVAYLVAGAGIWLTLKTG